MRVERGEGKWFRVKMGLQQRCLISPCLMRELNVMALEREAGLQSVRDGDPL